jgi:hypothetical protein
MSSTYQYCSKEECQERQSLGQVSELETTVETCGLPQAKRRLDPSFAVSKYRRSAAGSSHIAKSRLELEATLRHLLRVAVTCQASPNHRRVDDYRVVSEFLVDRLRAFQADATRSLGTDEPLAATWHARLARLLVWIRYWSVGNGDLLMPKTIDTMFHTTLDHYWGSEREAGDWDDEIMCLSASYQLSQSNSQDNFAKILLDYSKQRQPGRSYPLFHLSLKLTCHVTRQEYYPVWRMEELPILTKCCLSPVLMLWRYRTVQQYNVAFGKHEYVPGMDRLLGIQSGWEEGLSESFEVPVEFRDGVMCMVMKKQAMTDTPKLQYNPDLTWTFGYRYEPKEAMGMPSEDLIHLIETGTL